MNQLEQNYGILDINRPFSKRSSAQLRVECLANYGIHVKKEYIEEVTTILFEMVKDKFLNAIKKFSINDMFNNKSHELFKIYLEHYYLESTSFNEACFVVDYFEHSCLDINSKGIISMVFFKKYNTEILSVLKNFLKDQNTINEKKDNLITKYLQFIFVTQMNSSIICKDKKTYLQFQNFNFSEYLLDNCANNTNEVFQRIEIPNEIPMFLPNATLQMSTIRSLFRRSKGFSDYISDTGMIRNNLTTRELKSLSNEFNFLSFHYDQRLHAYVNLLSKALKVSGLSAMFVNASNFKLTLINSVLYYELIVYNLKEKNLEKLKQDLLSSL